MSDSLREQMLQAGFKESGKQKKSKPAKPRTRHDKAAAAAKKASSEQAAIAEKKRVKAEIKAIIETNKIDKTSGDIQHSYLVGTRIKQMFVNEDVRKRLISGEVVITRLNGSTFIIPAVTAKQVQTLNPDWVVIDNNSSSGDDDGTNGDYAEYKVPDDLQW